jgi:hypothetical protein
VQRPGYDTIMLLPILDMSAMGKNHPSQKHDLKEKTVSRVCRQTERINFRWETRSSGQKKLQSLAILYLDFLIDFMIVLSIKLLRSQRTLGIQVLNLGHLEELSNLY